MAVPTKLYVPVFLYLIFTCLVNISTAGKNWALLIAGSNGWPNYSAQSGVCHAYQTLRKSGFSNETIVVMMFDDIAYNPQNRLPGEIITRPKGPDVYKGVPKHYTKDEITAKTFLAVLRGDKAAVRKLIGRDSKVIESGPDDNIFVYFMDHGVHRSICMPNGHPYLHARDLNNTLTSMYKQKKYNQVLFYLEACYAGSMFYQILSPSIKVYATTAAGPTEMAQMIFCSFHWNTCLAGEYSCNWERDNDAADSHTETVGTQFEDTKENNKKSKVHEYGDMGIKNEHLSYFFGLNNSQDGYPSKVPPCVSKPLGSVPVPMAKMSMIKRKLAKVPASSGQARALEKQLKLEVKLMKETEDAFDSIAKIVFRGSMLSERQVFDLVYEGAYPKELDYDCYEDAVDILTGVCPHLHGSNNPYALPKLISLARACNARGYKDVVAAVKTVAMEHPLCRHHQ